MTPKEKAEQLVNQFKEYSEAKISDNGKDFDKKYCSKHCALITLKHMQSLLDGLHKPEYCAFDAIGERKFTFEGEYPEHMTGYDMISYLEEVKLELDKM
jgi:hypothetical protein